MPLAAESQEIQWATEAAQTQEPRSRSIPENVFGGIVAKIQAQDDPAANDAGAEELYKILRRGVRYYMARQLGAEDLEDKIHDTFLAVVRAIKQGDVREPERLMGFVRTIAQRQVQRHIGKLVKKRQEAEMETVGVFVKDPSPTPEQSVIVQEKARLMKAALDEMPTRDQEILKRFYLYEQPAEQICAEMKLTETQFRLFKSRAKAKFGQLGRRLLKNGLEARLIHLPAIVIAAHAKAQKRG